MIRGLSFTQSSLWPKFTYKVKVSKWHWKLYEPKSKFLVDDNVYNFIMREIKTIIAKYILEDTFFE